MRQGAVAGVSALINNRLYFHGGQDGNTMYSDLWSFDLAAKRFDALKFSTAVPRPAERWQGNMITRNAGDKMYIYCGQSQNSFLNGAYMPLNLLNHRFARVPVCSVCNAPVGLHLFPMSP